MTASSPYVGRRLGPASFFDTDSDLDAWAVRDLVCNNTLHAADEGPADVWVNFVAADSGLISGNPRQHVLGDISDVDLWFRLATLGPFQLSAFATDRPYLLRVRLLGATTSGGSAVSFAVSVGHVGTLADVGYATGFNAVEFASTSSSTPAWLSPSTPASGLVTLSTDELRSSLVAEATTDDSAGVPVDVQVHEVLVHVWGKTTNLAANAALYGLHVAQYVGG